MKVTVNVAEQTLSLHDDIGNLVKNYSVATAKNGVGQQFGSECTPLGKHIIRAKIGDVEPINTVFIARRPTGEIYNDDLHKQYPTRDWILTRILWLSGCETEYNRLGKCDTMRRYVYIHGAPDSHEMGIASSHGCIKMRNSDIIELFDLVAVGTQVLIVENN